MHHLLASVDCEYVFICVCLCCGCKQYCAQKEKAESTKQDTKYMKVFTAVVTVPVSTLLGTPLCQGTTGLSVQYDNFDVLFNTCSSQTVRLNHK